METTKQRSTSSNPTSVISIDENEFAVVHCWRAHADGQLSEVRVE